MVAMTSFLLAGCGDDDDDDDGGAPPIEPTVQVTDSAGAVVAGAAVYAIPAADVADLAAQPLTLAAGVYDAAALNVDEPLEDLINGNYTPTGGGVGTYTSAVTDANGEAVLTGLAVGAADMYFLYVAPAAADAGHLPGGSLCRTAVSGASLDNKVTPVFISTTPSAAATYIGSSACLACHPTRDTQKQTAHRHGIMVAGSPGPLQDLAKFAPTDGVFNYMAGLNKFTDGDATSGGTTVWFYDYDATRGFDKFKTLESDPGAGATVWATVRAYKDGAGKFQMEFTNVINPADPNSPMTREALMNYGGGVYKQRYLTSFDTSESLHLLPLQFNASGEDASTDRTRRVWRDYHLDFWMTVDTTTPANSTFKELPAASKSFDINCAPCHFTGFSITQDATTGDYSASAVADPNGEIHPLTGAQQELNIGCETCHGPGSEHQAAGGNGVAIVWLSYLTPEREAMVCGQCHSRPKGNDSFGVKGDAPLNGADKMLFPGTSRAAYLANQTSRHDATTSDLWADGLHSKSHHQQYTDFIQSAMYRNGSALQTCTACHDVHAPGTDRHQLTGTGDNTLCLGCHATIVNADHQVAETGSNLHSTAPARCIDCHAVKTAKSGAAEQDWNGGDISSHRLDVPLSATDAMPIPHNNACGVCHT
jgi:predicted CXXCH cytochrome family protein